MIVKPEIKEAKPNYLNRFMDHTEMKAEFPRRSIRISVAMVQWDLSKKVKWWNQAECCMAEIKKTMARRKIRLVKADYYDRRTSILADSLLTIWDEETRDAINELIRTIARGTGEITEEELKNKLKTFDKKLGTDLAGKMDLPVLGTTELVYTRAATEIVSGFSFNVIDEDAIEWIRSNQRYWIGNYYSKEMSDEILKAGKMVLEQQLGRDGAGKLFRKMFGDQFKQANNYWEGLSNHVVTRGREFGHIGAYQSAGITYAKIVAVIDKRTSHVCRALNGTVVPTSNMIATRDALINTKDPEDVKKVSPWPTNKQVKEKIVGSSPEKLPKHLSLPPYHFFCRTRTVESSRKEFTTQIQEIELDEVPSN